MKKYLVGFTSALLVTFYALAAFAQEAAPAGTNDKAMGAALAAAVAIGLAALGGAIGQGRVAAAALEGIARNPSADGKIRAPMFVGLALIESLVLYALLIAYLLQQKV